MEEVILTCSKCKYRPFCKGILLKDDKCLSFYSDYPEECPICRGRDWVLLKEDEGMECLCHIFKRVRSYLSVLGNSFLELPDHSVENLKGVETNQDLFIDVAGWDYDTARSLCAYLLLKGGLRRTYDVITLYQFIQVFLGVGDIADKYSSLDSLTTDVLIILYRDNQVPNKLYTDVVLHVLDFRRFKNKKTWFLCMDKLSHFLPAVSKYIMNYVWFEIEFKHGVKGDKGNKGGMSYLDVISHNIEQANEERPK